MTCSGAFWEQNFDILKTVRLTFFKLQSTLNSVHLWPETLIDSLSTLG